MITLELEHAEGFELDPPDDAWLVVVAEDKMQSHTPVATNMASAIAAGRWPRHVHCPRHDMLRFEDKRLEDIHVAAYILGGNAAVAELIKHKKWGAW